VDVGTGIVVEVTVVVGETVVVVVEATVVVGAIVVVVVDTAVVVGAAVVVVARVVVGIVVVTVFTVSELPLQAEANKRKQTTTPNSFIPTSLPHPCGGVARRILLRINTFRCFIQLGYQGFLTVIIGGLIDPF